MDYKQKYEQALEYMRKVYPTLNGADKEDAEHYFPELKESEDEKIRKHLLRHFRNKTKDEWNGMPIKNIIAWLEELDEPQKYPKDVIDNAISFLANRNNGMSEEDAKDIVNAIITVLNPSYWPKQVEKKPADKIKPRFKVGDTIVEKDPDECDYETIKDIKNGRYIFTDGYCMNIDEQEGWQLVKTPTIIEQKPAWSEEDEEMFDAIIADIQFTQKAHTHEVNQVVYEREIDWLKSLKQRMKGESK